ncbi:MAG: serine hydrolase domain-containing protein [Candidatus Dormibacteria bacterium]
MARDKAVSQALERGMARLGIPGASVALRDGGRSEAQVAAGLDPLGQAAPSTSDVRPYWSLGKTFIATTFCALAAGRRINLDSVASTWVPEAELGPEVTIRRLLNHTAGIVDYGSQPGYQRAVRETPEEPWGSANYLAVARLPPTFASGTEWEYSNTGYFLLRLILHRAFGRSIDRTLADTTLRPLGLNSVKLLRDREDMMRLAPGVSTFWGEPVDARTRYLPDWVGSGMLAGTAIDGARFYDRLLRGEALTPDWLEQMLDGRAVTGKPPGWVRPTYGLGLMIDRDHPLGVVVGHGGDGPGYGAAAFRVTRGRKSVTVCVLTNCDGGRLAEELALELAAAHLRA